MSHGHDVTVRLATPDDVDVLCEMMQDFNAHEHIPWTRAMTEAPLRQLIEDEGLGRVLVCVEQAETIGYAVMTWGFDLEWAGRDAFLTELYVRPTARGRGVSHTLMGQVEHVAHLHGVKALHLMVHKTNTRAFNLYTRSGFKDTERLVMSKPL